MGIKEIPLKDFVAYLQHLGLEVKRTKGSHTSFNFPEGDRRKLSRPIILRMNYKTIPLLHIHTNLQTISKTKDDFIDWQTASQKGKKGN